MPRGDGTGPRGMGPLAGRGAGFCAEFNGPGYLNPGFNNGVGFGRGFVRGRGFRQGFCYSVAPGFAPLRYPVYGGACSPAGTEKDYLNGQVEILEKELELVKKRLQEISEEENE
jgi:hypothetical protein